VYNFSAGQKAAGVACSLIQPYLSQPHFSCRLPIPRWSGLYLDWYLVLQWHRIRILQDADGVNDFSPLCRVYLGRALSRQHLPASEFFMIAEALFIWARLEGAALAQLGPGED
jgi:hypothetical protein